MLFASSVLPTPVGPKNKNEPIGRFGSFNPALARRTALATAVTASSLDLLRVYEALLPKWSKVWDSSSAILATGIPVHCATTAAISSSVTTNF